ncbi:MAG: hypothetical protein K2X06_16980 [Burkholderiales bacterium]|nr:hypothetical protein [Burkholderiales bacterium]
MGLVIIGALALLTGNGGNDVIYSDRPRGEPDNGQGNIDWIVAGAASNRHPRFSHHQQGFSTLTWLLAIPAFLIALLILAILFYEGRKAYWDAQVKEMCAKDGGVTISEQIVLSKADYDRLGGQGGIIPIPSEGKLSIKSPFFTKRIESIINEGNPKVYKVQNLFVRNIDQKVLAISVRYVRAGGDFPSFAHPSSLLCPDQTQTVAQERKIFSIDRGAK